MIVRVFLEQATVETEKFPTVILEVIGISCRRFHFGFQKESDTLGRFLGTMVKVCSGDGTYVRDSAKQIISQKDSTHEIHCLKQVWA